MASCSCGAALPPGRRAYCSDRCADRAAGRRRRESAAKGVSLTLRVVGNNLSGRTLTAAMLILEYAITMGVSYDVAEALLDERR